MCKKYKNNKEIIICVIIYKISYNKDNIIIKGFNNVEKYI